MKSHFITILKQKSGIAIMSVMLFFFVMTIFLSALSFSSMSNVRVSGANSQSMAAFYAAEAGLNFETEHFVTFINDAVNQRHTLQQLLNGIDQYIIDNQNRVLSLTNNENHISQATVSVTSLGEHDGQHRFRITSIGQIGPQQRIVSRDVMFNYIPGGPSDGNSFTIDKAILTRGSINASGLTVTGNPVATFSSNPGSVFLDWGTRLPGVQIPQNTQKETIVTRISPSLSYNTAITGGLNSITYLDEIFEFPPIVMPTYPVPNTLPRLPSVTNFPYNSGLGTLIDANGNFVHSTWSANRIYSIPNQQDMVYYVPKFIIRGNENFTINTGNANTTFIVDTFIIEGALQVTGNGTLTIIVRGNSASNPIRVNQQCGAPCEPKFRYVYTGGNGHIGNPQHPQRFKLFFEDLFQEVQVGQGGNRRIEVHPVTWTVGGSSPVYASIMASNMNFNLVGSGKIDGYLVTGGTSITVSGGSSSAVALYYAPNARFSLTGGGSINGAIIADNFVSSGNVRVTYSDVSFTNFPFAVFTPITGGGNDNNLVPQFNIVQGITFEH